MNNNGLWKFLQIFGGPLLIALLALVVFYFTTPLIYATKSELNELDKQVQAQAIKQEYIAKTVDSNTEKLDKILEAITKLSNRSE